MANTSEAPNPPHRGKSVAMERFPLMPAAQARRRRRRWRRGGIWEDGFARDNPNPLVSRLLSQAQSHKEVAENAKVWGRLFFNTEAQRHEGTERGGSFHSEPQSSQSDSWIGIRASQPPNISVPLCLCVKIKQDYRD